MTKISIEISKKKSRVLARQDTTSLGSDGLIKRLNENIQSTKEKINNQKKALSRISKNVDAMNQLTSQYIGSEIESLGQYEEQKVRHNR